MQSNILNMDIVKNDKRIYWIDNLKAIGIFLVVMGHTTLPLALKQHIYSFHMPLFFFISGILFFPEKYKSIRDFVRKKSKSILIPYFLLNLIVYLYWVSSGIIKTGLQSIDPLKLKLGVGILYGRADYLFDYPLWFLACLFIVEVLYYAINNRNKILTLGFIVCLAVMGYLYSLYVRIPLPWNIESAFTGILFYGSGYLMRDKINTVLSVLSKYKALLAIVVLLSINILSIQLNYRFSYLPTGYSDLCYNHIGQIFFFYIAAFSGISSYMLISKQIKNYKIISLIGKNSITVLAFHVIFFSFTNKLTYRLLPAALLNGSFHVSLINSVITIVALIPLIILIKNYFPIFIGRPKISTDTN